ncbi:MAG: HlyD family type I secretion periplasmic adaptor subunit [Gammaproteobacteria bacterium]|nr:MAG: HlyD family type I secretion periplasmic adaptor subunit [Gammaproteobacteria bacterium]RKZ77273.1 MAG: HlyD family type I secretion periplasmic adaptor subunit [Gammaproteobacteria bacterium]
MKDLFGQRAREYQYFLDSKPSRFSHLILWITLLFFASAGVWAYYSKLDEVTRGTGKVIPSSHVQVVQNLEGGIVSEILMKEGEIVKKGQVLLRIDDTRFSSSYRESQVTSSAMEAKKARLIAEYQGKPFKLSPKWKKRELFLNERALAQSRQQELQAGIAILNQQQTQKRHEIKELKSKQRHLQHSYDFLQKELKITHPLVKKGVMSEVELLRLQREASLMKAELENTRLSIPRVEAAIIETDHKIEEIKVNFRTQALAELNEIRAELSRMSESKRALKDRVTRTAVRSPMKGTIKQIKVTTIGGVVQPGMDLVEIVPLKDSLLIEAQIRPSDIAFLHPGQMAMIKLTAYDFSIFGGLKASLEHISADTIINERGEPFFLIRLRTERNYLGTIELPLPIIAGMTVNVDILTGKKSLLDYLLKPIKKAQERALRER